MADENTGAPPSNPTPVASVGEPTSDDKNMAMLAHLLGILTWFVGALVIWLIKKESKSFAADQAREALNFQITVTIVHLAAAVTICLGVGVVLVPLVWVANLVFCILGAVTASKGEAYRYPVAIRLIK